MPPSFEEVEGYIGGSAYLPVCASVTLALVQEPLKIESWNITCGLTMLIKGPFYSFSLHLELQSYTLFYNLL